MNASTSTSSQSPSRRIVIIGGVAAGMSAATRARRMKESAQITVLEKGGYISFANCGLPYYLAGRIEEESKLLVTTPAIVRERFNIDVRLHHEVRQIDRVAREVEVFDHAKNQTLRLPYDKLIIATGASAIIPPLDHVHAANVFLLRSMEDTQVVEKWLGERGPRSVAIIGAGFIGLEMAEAMRQRGLDVTVIEKAPHALPPLDPEMAASIAEELKQHRVSLITACGLASLRAKDGLVTTVVLEDGREVAADMVLLSIGVRPNARLAQEAGLKIGETGGIAVDAYQRSTSDENLYAAGDVAEVIHGVTGRPARIPLAGPANRQGRVAGEHAATGTSPAAGTVIGSAIVQVFGLAVGVTGLSERDARRLNLDVAAAFVSPAHHASYYPGSHPLRIKLVYEKPTGRILGAQAVGRDGVDKRIDVIATAVHFGGTVDDLAALDLAYAPQFASAKDPIHMAAFVAQNQRRGLMDALSPMDLARGHAEDEFLLDVRTASEFAAGTLPGAINIPIDQLRSRVRELDPQKEIVTFCKSGQRGYIAERILIQNGFDRVRNLQGGYELARLLVPKSAKPNPAPSN